MRTPAPRRVLLVAAATAALAGSAVVVPLQVEAAQTLRENCTATIDETGSSTSSFATAFQVTSNTPFSEDRSTPTRQQTFDAAIVGQTVQVDWFKDVNVFDYVDLAFEVPLNSGRGSTHGRVLTGNSTFQHVFTYTVSCTKA